MMGPRACLLRNQSRRICAERRTGELLREMEKHQGARGIGKSAVARDDREGDPLAGSHQAPLSAGRCGSH